MNPKRVAELDRYRQARQTPKPAPKTLLELFGSEPSRPPVAVMPKKPRPLHRQPKPHRSPPVDPVILAAIRALGSTPNPSAPPIVNPKDSRCHATLANFTHFRNNANRGRSTPVLLPSALLPPLP